MEEYEWYKAEIWYRSSEDAMRYNYLCDPLTIQGCYRIWEYWTTVSQSMHQTNINTQIIIQHSWDLTRSQSPCLMFWKNKQIKFEGWLWQKITLFCTFPLEFMWKVCVCESDKPTEEINRKLKILGPPPWRPFTHMAPKHQGSEIHNLF